MKKLIILIIIAVIAISGYSFGFFKFGQGVWNMWDSSGISPPAILEDGNTTAWYDYAENITEATGVSVWGDKSGNNNDLEQSTGVRQTCFF